MKAGFWVAPEGEDASIAIAPIDPEPAAALKRNTFLATREAEALIRRCRRAAALLPELIAALASQTPQAPGRLFDIADFPDDDRRLVGEALGEGEVGGVATLPSGLTAQIQESVLAGLWRLRFTDPAGALVANCLEVGALPEVVFEACRAASPTLALTAAPPEGAMNVMPVLAEIREAMANRRPGAPPHVLNFSLFPMTPHDMAFLQATLGVGPVRLVSRGYGLCRTVATQARGVWSVQFTNAMDAVVLDTLEVCDAPSAVLAAAEDFRDSAARLEEIAEAYFR